MRLRVHRQSNLLAAEEDTGEIRTMKASMRFMVACICACYHMGANALYQSEIRVGITGRHKMAATAVRVGTARRHHHTVSVKTRKRERERQRKCERESMGKL